MPSSRSARLSRPVASLVAALTLASTAFGHSNVIQVYGANGKIGHGYGVNIYGKFPRVKGEAGDAGGDVSVFQAGLYPQPACGSTGELGELDTGAWLSQAEGFGIPSAYPNASVVFEVFQVNRDGGGPMFCAYSSDASLSDSSWVNMTMTLNQAGNNGFIEEQRVNETIVATFPENAKCTGGIGGNTCVVRCRTGVNSRTLAPHRFGSCFAVRLNGTEGATESTSSSNSTTTTTVSTNSTASTAGQSSTASSASAAVATGANRAASTSTTSGAVAAASSSSSSTSSSGSSGSSSSSQGSTSTSSSSSSSSGCSTKTERVTLSTKQMNKIVNAVVKKMKKSGLVYKAPSKSKKSTKHRTRPHHI